MTPPKLRIQDIKTGRIREITEYAHKINVKHGMDKSYQVLPALHDIEKAQKIADSEPEAIPTFDPYTNEMTIDSFEEAEINPTDEYGYKISDGLMQEPVKKKKRGRKPKNDNNE